MSVREKERLYAFVPVYVCARVCVFICMMHALVTACLLVEGKNKLFTKTNKLLKRQQIQSLEKKKRAVHPFVLWMVSF